MCFLQHRGGSWLCTWCPRPCRRVGALGAMHAWHACCSRETFKVRIPRCLWSQSVPQRRQGVGQGPFDAKQLRNSSTDLSLVSFASKSTFAGHRGHGRAQPIATLGPSTTSSPEAKTSFASLACQAQLCCDCQLKPWKAVLNHFCTRESSFRVPDSDRLGV